MRKWVRQREKDISYWSLVLWKVLRMWWKRFSLNLSLKTTNGAWVENNFDVVLLQFWELSLLFFWSLRFSRQNNFLEAFWTVATREAFPTYILVERSLLVFSLLQSTTAYCVTIRMTSSLETNIDAFVPKLSTGSELKFAISVIEVSARDETSIYVLFFFHQVTHPGWWKTTKFTQRGAGMIAYNKNCEKKANSSKEDWVQWKKETQSSLIYNV